MRIGRFGLKKLLDYGLCNYLNGLADFENIADQGLALNFGLDFELYLFEAFVQSIDQQLGSL